MLNSSVATCLGLAVAVVDVAASEPDRAGPGWIENRGQWPSGVQYVAQLPGLLVRADASAIGLQLASADGGQFVRLELLDSCAGSGWKGHEAREGRYHYYFGDVPSSWVRNARAFDSVRWEGAYPGIDLVLSIRDGNPKYDLHVAPGADLGALRLACRGAQAVEPDAAGGVRLWTELGPILQLPALSWQVLPSGERRELSCRWRMTEEGALRLECPEWDPSLPLVVDPELVWSTYLGGTSSTSSGDIGKGVAVDADGDLVVVGRSEGDDFPTTPGAFQKSGRGLYHITCTKLRATDGTLVYSSVFGGAGSQRPEDVAVTYDGRATVGGWTQASTFPVTPGAWDAVRGQAPMVGFVTQFTDLGDDLVFSTYVEGDQSGGVVYGVDIGPNGDVFVGGSAGPDFPATPCAADVSFGGEVDSFVLRLDPAGSTLLWSTFLGGSEIETLHEIAAGPDGSIVAVGVTDSMDFPITRSAPLGVMSSPFTVLGYVTRVAADGSAFDYSTYIGADEFGEFTEVLAVDVDRSDSITIVGRTDTGSFPTTPDSLFPESPLPQGNGGSFVARLHPDGRSFLYSTFLGGEYGGFAESVTVDASGVCTVAGTTPLGFPTTPGAFDTTEEAGPTDFFVSRLSPRGDRLFYSTYLGGPTNETQDGLALTASGRVAISGDCNPPGGYPTTPDAPFPEYQGGQSDLVATSFDLLLAGVREFGASTPSCLGVVRAGVTEMPRAGADGFGLYASGAPPDAHGSLLVALGPARADVAPAHETGLLIDPTRILARVPVQSDAFGFAEAAFPLRSDWVGRRLYAQFVFGDAPPCSGPGQRSASFALEITVQP